MREWAPLDIGRTFVSLREVLRRLRGFGMTRLANHQALRGSFKRVRFIVHAPPVLDFLGVRAKAGDTNLP
jgi:hypothetical protein